MLFNMFLYVFGPSYVVPYLFFFFIVITHMHFWSRLDPHCTQQ